MVNIEKIRLYTQKQYNKAKQSLTLLEHRDSTEFSAISDAIPGYTANSMDFGAYKKDKFAVLFIDMRSSTNRAKCIGEKSTFLSMHAFIPAMLKVVEHYKGIVIDITGDGLMVFFGGEKSDFSNEKAMQNAGLCGTDMLITLKEVVNPILENDGITYDISCGVGVDYGEVIVTKIGIDTIFDVKAYGDCINDASHFSEKAVNQVIVSKYVRNHWPKGKNGKIHFSSTDNEGYIIHDGR